MKAADGAPVGVSPSVAVVDGAGTVIGWTEAAEQLTGYPAAAIVGRPVNVLLPSDGARLPRTGLTEVRRRDGGTVVVWAEASPLTLGDGPGHWLVSAMPTAAYEATGTGALLKLLGSSFPVAMALWDRDLRCVWLNDAARQLSRGYPHYRIGRSLTEAVEGVDTEALQEVMRRVLAGGPPVIDREASWSHRCEERVMSISLFPVEGTDGRPLGVCSVALDFSTSQARDRLRLLREASVRLGSTLDVMKTAQALAELAVPGLADHVTVELAEALLPTEQQRRPVTTEAGLPVLRRVGVASVDDEQGEAPLWTREETVSVSSGSPIMELLHSRRPHFEPVLNLPGGWATVSSERVRAFRAAGLHSLIAVPLEAGAEVLGVAIFGRTVNPAPFTRDDLMLAEELVTRASFSLENARQYTRERLTALTLQRDLLPHDLRGSAAVEVASRYLPCTHEKVGGDWYDVIHLPGDRIALVVGDVTGHGITAAATMGRLRTAVRTLAKLELPPDQLLTHLDQLMADDARGFETAGATCLYAVHDPRTGCCTMATAGHPPPAIVGPSGDVTFPSLPVGPPVGVGLGSYEAYDVHLPAGTVLALYTDGLIERRRTDLDAGMAELGAALAHASSSATLDGVCTDVIDSLVGEAPAEDDIALLVARTRV